MRSPLHVVKSCRRSNYAALVKVLVSSLFEKEWFPDNHGFLGPVLVLGPGMSMWKAAVRHERLVSPSR